MSFYLKKKKSRLFILGHMINNRFCLRVFIITPKYIEATKDSLKFEQSYRSYFVVRSKSWHCGSSLGFLFELVEIGLKSDINRRCLMTIELGTYTTF